MNAVLRMLEMVDRLRGPEGCPWDREQTVATLAPQLREEVCEVLGALNALDPDNLREELGDMLFGVLMICRTAEERLGIPLAEVAEGIVAKMIRRHPHVFAEVEVAGAGQVVANWESIKAREKNLTPGSSLFAETSPHLPALARAQKLQKKAARVGFDWENTAGVAAKIREELAEVEAELARGDRQRLGEEIGDLLFSAVNLARFQGLDAETLLHRMIERWVGRFQRLEELARQRGLEIGKASLPELDALWEEVKRRLKAELQAEG